MAVQSDNGNSTDSVKNGVHHTKFSDLSSFLQAQQARAGLLLATIALSVAATGSVGANLNSPPVGAWPLLPIIAVAALILGLLGAVGALATPSDFVDLIMRRFEARNLETADTVDVQRHAAFIKEFRRRQENLNFTHYLVADALLTIISYGLMTRFSTLIPQGPLTSIACNKLAIPMTACSFNLMSGLIAAILLVTNGWVIFKERYEQRQSQSRRLPPPPAATSSADPV